MQPFNSYAYISVYNYFHNIFRMHFFNSGLRMWLALCVSVQLNVQNCHLQKVKMFLNFAIESFKKYFQQFLNFSTHSVFKITSDKFFT